MSSPSVYISSTYEDLKPYREAAFRALEKAGFQVGRMEGYTASDERPLTTCLNDVETRDVYVGILAWRYGYIPPKEHGNPNGWSITECEYRHAVANHKPVLCFFLDEKAAADWPDAFKDEKTGAGEGGALIRALRRDLGTEKMVDIFRSPEQLAYQVLAAIIRRGTARRPFVVPPLPADFVPRPKVTGAIVASLLAEGTETLAVHGSAGFGKTTLAVAVCHEPEVVKAFPDGTVWVTLGDKDPQSERKLAEIYAAFTGNQPVETTVIGIVSEIRQKLSAKRCLLVVDDVWSDTALEPFAGLGATRLLLTTRKRELAADRPDIEVKEMVVEESMQLLSRGMPDASNHQAALATFVLELGGWALLLELTNARLRIETRAQGSFEAALAYVKKVYLQRGVTGFDRKDTKERNKSVVNCLDTGLDAYKETVPTLRERAAELGLFPEDVAIPEQVLSEFWDCDELTLNEDTLRHLDDLSIIQWDRKQQAVRLHDSVRGVLATWIPDKTASHRRLLDTWGDAKRLPNAYAWQWYGWHCLRAGRREEFLRLLMDFDWMQAKFQKSDIAALIVEYSRATAAENVARTRSESKVDTEREFLLRIQSVLKLSAHVLTHDKTQLAAQLLARIPEGGSVWDQMRERALAIPHPWLRPLTASLASEQSLRWLKPSGETLWNVAFSRNGRWAAHVSSTSGGPTSNVVLWDLKEWLLTGPKFRTLARLSPFALAVSDDARWCFYADSIGGVHRLGPAGEVWEGHAHRDITVAKWLRISADGKRALSACQHGRLVAWDIDANHHEIVWDENDNNGLAMSLDPTGTSAVVVRADGSVVAIELWPARQRILFKLDSRPTAVATSWDFTTIIVAGEGGSVEVRRLDSPEPAIAKFVTEEQPTAVAVSADSRNVAIGTDRGTVEVWSIPLSERTARYTRAHTYAVEQISFSQDDARVISADSLHIKEWALNAPVQRESPARESHAIGQVKVTADGLHAVALLEDGRLGVWNLHTGILESALSRGEGAVVNATRFGTEAGISFATKIPHILAWNETCLCVWNLATGACVGSLGVTETRDACITPDGKSVVYLDGANLAVWRPQESSSKTLGMYKGDRPSYVAISPDGCFALSSGGDRQVHLWRLGAPAPGSVMAKIRSRRGNSSFEPEASYWPNSPNKPSRVVFVGPREALVTTGDGSMFLLEIKDDPLGRTELNGRKHSGGSDGGIWRIVVDAKRRIFLTSSYVQKIIVWGMDEPYHTDSIQSRPGFVEKLNLSANRMLLTTRDGLLRIAGRDGTVLAAFQGDKQITACDADAELNWVVALDQGGQMHFFHVEQGLSASALMRRA